MSSESFSSISESDMIEGSAVNAVLESQVDPSISQSLCQGSSASVPRLKIETDFEIPKKESHKIRRPKSLMNKVKELMSSPVKLSLNDHQSGEKLPSKKALRKIPNVSRFYSFQQKIQEKIEKHRELKRQEEEKECTFKPTVRSNQRKRTPKEVYKDIMKHQSHRDKRIQEMQELKQQEQEICHFRPYICGKSKQIMQAKSYVSEKCHERLYGMFRKPLFGKSVADEISKYSELDPFSSKFIPQVSRLSRAIKNKRPIAERLYADAMRRRSIESTPENLTSEQATPSNNSMRILIEGFLDEFTKKARKLDPKRTGRINYYKFIALFKHLHFLNENSKKFNDDIIVLLGLWKTIGGTDSAELKDLKVLMMGIMGYYQPWMNDSTQQGFLLSKEGMKKIHDKYLHLFENRCSFSLSKSVKVIKNTGTKKRTDDSRKVEDSLIEQGKMKELRIEILREKITAESMKECTFQPEKNLASSRLLSRKSSFNYEDEEGSLSKRYRRMSVSSNDTFNNLFNYATLIKDERNKSFDLKHNEIEMFSRTDSQLHKKKTPKINFLEEINDQVPSLYFTQAVHSDVIYENDADLYSGQSSLMNTPKDTAEILWKMVHTKKVSDSSEEKIQTDQPFSGFGDTCEELEKINENYSKSFNESFEESFNRSERNSDKGSSSKANENRRNKSETSERKSEKSYNSSEKSDKQSRKSEKKPGESPENLETKGENEGSLFRNRQKQQENSHKSHKVSPQSEKSSSKSSSQEKPKNNSASNNRDVSKRTKKSEKHSSSKDFSDEKSQFLYSGNPEDDEGFVVSVNIKGQSQKSALTIKSALTAEADVQAFSAQNKLTTKEKDKLLAYVKKIIS